LYQTGENAVGFKPSIGSGAEANFTEDRQMSDSLLCQIVCRRHTGVAQESKEILLLRPCQTSP